MHACGEECHAFQQARDMRIVHRVGGKPQPAGDLRMRIAELRGQPLDRVEFAFVVGEQGVRHQYMVRVASSPSWPALCRLFMASNSGITKDVDAHLRRHDGGAGCSHHIAGPYHDIVCHRINAAYRTSPTLAPVPHAAPPRCAGAASSPAASCVSIRFTRTDRKRGSNRRIVASISSRSSSRRRASLNAPEAKSGMP